MPPRQRRFHHSPSQHGASLLEVVILLSLLLLALIFAFPAAFPYLKKAGHQARTIQEWESSP
jgi:hypothetical protein